MLREKEEGSAGCKRLGAWGLMGTGQFRELMGALQG